MNYASPQAWLMVLIIALLMSCNNDSNELKPNAIPACFLHKEGVLGDPRHTLFEYSSGNPTRITDFRDVGDPFDVTEIYPEKTIKTNVDKIYPTYSSSLTKYDTDIFERSPSVASFSYTVNDVTTHERKCRFRYDRNGRMIEVKQSEELGSTTNFTLTIDYDDNDNVRQLHYHYPDSPDTITVVATGYDSKPTPYAGIKGWKFIGNGSGSIWNNANHLAALTALSQNNPRGYLHFVNDKVTYELTYKYQYNEQGFPTQRDQVYKTEISEFHATYAYEYECP